MLTEVHPPRVNEGLLQSITKAIVSGFDPEKIVLFGSHAWGEPEEWSDVDLLVIMHSNDPPHRRAANVALAARPFLLPMDILVRTPGEIRARLEMGDFFVKEILERGRVLYERDTSR